MQSNGLCRFTLQQKDPLHQQKFLVVLVFSHLPWLLKKFKKYPK